MKLKQISVEDKKIFSQYLDLTRHELSVYAFENIYLWKSLFQIRWSVIENSLCVFFQDKVGSFLYLAPLSGQPDPKGINSAFSIMDSFNSNREISRIENVEAGDVDSYLGLGYECIQKSSDFVCRRQDLSLLKGNTFKSKRWSLNYFRKHNDFEYLTFSQGEHKSDCLKLYSLWGRQRKDKVKDAFYQGMLQDNFSALKVLLNNYRDLNCIGRIVKIDNQLKAFTFGFKLNQDTLCILYEITDLSVKGLAQFIFREFCAGLSEFSYINIMDDSGLANLKKVKLSYHPYKLIPAYIVKRKSNRI